MEIPREWSCFCLGKSRLAGQPLFHTFSFSHCGRDVWGKRKEILKKRGWPPCLSFGLIFHRWSACGKSEDQRSFSPKKDSGRPDHNSLTLTTNQIAHFVPHPFFLPIGCGCELYLIVVNVPDSQGINGLTFHFLVHPRFSSSFAAVGKRNENVRLENGQANDEFYLLFSHLPPFPSLHVVN